MSTPAPEATQSNPQEGAQTAPGGESATTQDPTPVPGENTPQNGSQEPVDSDEGDINDLPEWGRKRLTRANNDAARYRTQLREVEERFKGAKTLEEFQAAQAEWDAERIKMQREVVAGRHGLPAEIGALLQGETEAELEAHATTLKALFPAKRTPSGDLHGGTDPHTPDAYAGKNPMELARMTRR